VCACADCSLLPVLAGWRPRVLPRSGNPHNQLAVMAVMTGDELRAVYHYARSLCVGLPFHNRSREPAAAF